MPNLNHWLNLLSIMKPYDALRNTEDKASILAFGKLHAVITKCQISSNINKELNDENS